ncbi:MAG TPA: DUF2478 domain-containing protein [Alphaproteobacteria bacterium]|nr:DUF2478 domain-containing protein [Alphaproteobacteria bacterium]
MAMNRADQAPATLAPSLATPPPLVPGVVLYAPDSPKSRVLHAFAEELSARGFAVAGVVIDTLYDGADTKTGLDLIDLATKRRLPYARPGTRGIEIGRWVLDPATVEAGERAIASAVASDADLIVIDKFGPLEGRGAGFATGLAAALACGRPVLIAARSEFLDGWDAFAARPTVALRPTLEDLWRWWGPYRLYDDLARGVADAPARRVVLGLNWTLVEGPEGCGLAHSPARDAPGCRPLARAGDYAGMSLKTLAKLSTSWNPFEAALGLAAINAHYNRPGAVPAGEGANGLELFASLPGRKLVVGRFPEQARRMPDALVIERVPAAGELPAHAADWVLPAADAVAITASALGNLTLPGILERCRGVRAALIGPGTPLTPRLHAYGIDWLSGLVIEDADLAARAIAEGGAVKALKRCGRMATLARPPARAEPRPARARGERAAPIPKAVP